VAGEEAAKAYGKIPPLEWWRALTDKSHATITHNETLCEDYEIGMSSSGEFFVGYGCSCSECDFKFSFDQKEQVLGKDGP
jgi:hypothetical protein